MSRLAREYPDNPEYWDAPPVHVTVRAFPPRCRCSHAESQHYRDRSGRPNCVAVCACTAFRPEETTS